MTDDQIISATPAAERRIITRDGFAITVGLKVGDFSQSVILPMGKDATTQRAILMDTYRGLKLMNKKAEYDLSAAPKNTRR